MKKLYFNAGGEGGGGGGAGGGLGTVAVAVIGIVGGMIAQEKDASERRKMEEKLATMSLAQQHELGLKIIEAQGNVAKMAILYEALRIDKDRTATSELNRQRYIAISVLGAGCAVLGIVLLLHKLK